MDITYCSGKKMIITPSDFENGGVVDFSGHFHHRGRYGRVTVRAIPFTGFRKYRVVRILHAIAPIPFDKPYGPMYECIIHWHRDKSEEMVCSGSIRKCVRIANLLTDTDDEVQR